MSESNLVDQFAEEAERQAAETAGDPEAAATLVIQARLFVQADARVKALKEQLKEAQKEHDQLRKMVIPDLMQRAGYVDPAGRGSVSLSTGEKIHLRTDTYVSCTGGQKPQLFAWLRREGLDDLIREDVNAQTLKALVKERVSEELPLPPDDVVTRYDETTAIIRKS